MKLVKIKAYKGLTKVVEGIKGTEEKGMTPRQRKMMTLGKRIHYVSSIYWTRGRK